MHKILIKIAFLFAFVASSPAIALDGNETLRAWKDATAQERSDYLHALLLKSARDFEYGKILKCLDDTANIAVHAAFPIGATIDVCSKAGKSDQPV